MYIEHIPHLAPVNQFVLAFIGFSAGGTFDCVVMMRE